MKKRFAALAAVLTLGLAALENASAVDPTPATDGVTRTCLARFAARGYADSLAKKITNALAPQVSSGAITRPRVKVAAVNRIRQQRTTVDFARDVTVAVDLNATGDKVTLTGTPAAGTLYQSCDAGATTFTIFISYRTTDTAGAVTPVSIRQSFDATIPGQYL